MSYIWPSKAKHQIDCRSTKPTSWLWARYLPMNNNRIWLCKIRIRSFGKVLSSCSRDKRLEHCMRSTCLEFVKHDTCDPMKRNTISNRISCFFRFVFVFFNEKFNNRFESPLLSVSYCILCTYLQKRSFGVLCDLHGWSLRCIFNIRVIRDFL